MPSPLKAVFSPCIPTSPPAPISSGCSPRATRRASRSTCHGAGGARRPRSHRVQEPERPGARAAQRVDGRARRGQRPERRPRRSRRRRRVLDTPGPQPGGLRHPLGARTFQVANQLSPIVEVSDRFHVKPLLRSATFPQAAYVLALSQNAARLVEVSPDEPPVDIKVPGMPSDAASSVGKASIADRSADRRIQGSEGQKVRLRQYSRRVEEALRPLLSGLDLPLILAATEPLASIFRAVNTYPHLATRSSPATPTRRPTPSWPPRAGACSTSYTPRSSRISARNTTARAAGPSERRSRRDRARCDLRRGRHGVR